MGEEPARQATSMWVGGDEPAGDAVGDVVRALGWAGTALPEVRLFGCRWVPVVVLDAEAHQARTQNGEGPELDEDTLTVWEWPESAGRAPASALRLSGALFSARDGWRRALGEARRWRAFGPAAVLAPPSVVGDEVCRWECALHGVGLAGVRLITTNDMEEVTAAEVTAEVDAVVPAEPGRAAPARRRVADRWLEETLYGLALDTGAFPRTAQI